MEESIPIHCDECCFDNMAGRTTFLLTMLHTLCCIYFTRCHTSYSIHCSVKTCGKIGDILKETTVMNGCRYLVLSTIFPALVGSGDCQQLSFYG